MISTDLDPDKLPAEFAELAKGLEALPEPQRVELIRAYNRLVEWVNLRESCLTQVLEALSELRFNVKCLIFDLESTRQERDEFKRQLEK